MFRVGRNGLTVILVEPEVGVSRKRGNGGTLPQSFWRQKILQVFIMLLHPNSWNRLLKYITQISTTSMLPVLFKAVSGIFLKPFIFCRKGHAPWRRHYVRIEAGAVALDSRRSSLIVISTWFRSWHYSAANSRKCVRWRHAVTAQHIIRRS
ncbi:hypothetical protein TNCV_3176011 [Trichonephila clavipes]|nr:hypothetical protein TNCV_3176011 [Trichonephila clavipes]